MLRPMIVMLLLLGPVTVLPGQGSSIASVTVFEDRARIERARSVSLEPGVTEVRFENLPALLDPDSVSARVDGVEVLGVRLEWARHEEDVREAIAALEKAIQAKRLEEQKIQRRMNMAGKELDLASEYADYLATVLEKGSTIGEWTDGEVENALEAEASLAEWLLAAGEEVDALKATRETIRRERANLEKNLERRRSPVGRVTRTAVVLVRVAAACDGPVSVAYDVREARWEPLYEARLDETRAVVEWSYRARVTQRSGEDWSGVRLVLSTARSSLGFLPPTLVPVRIGGYATSGRSVGVARKPAQALEEDAPAPEREGGAGDERDDLSRAIVTGGAGPVRFEIRAPATVPSDGEPHQVSIHSDAIAADLGYDAIPRLKPHVYRRAAFANSTELPFLPGTVRVFREGAYVGDAPLEAVAPGQTVRLYFGAEGRITARRLEIRRKEEDAGTFTSDREITIGFRFDVENFLATPVSIALTDAIPVSDLEDVTVELTSRTDPEPAVGEDGVVRWTLDLAPGESRSVTLEYGVRHPRIVPLDPDWFE